MNNCGNCKHCRYDRELGERICQNEESDNYGLEADYGESCEMWEERD